MNNCRQLQTDTGSRIAHDPSSKEGLQGRRGCLLCDELQAHVWWASSAAPLTCCPLLSRLHCQPPSLLAFPCTFLPPLPTPLAPSAPACFSSVCHCPTLQPFWLSWSLQQLILWDDKVSVKEYCCLTEVLHSEALFTCRHLFSHACSLDLTVVRSVGLCRFGH